jgi:succinate dehydrogenase / fumarate reductase membrane anchor subunit
MSDGIKHWKYSRVSSILLIPLTIWFVAFFSKNFGMPFEQVSNSLSRPLNFLLMFTFITATIFHLQQGLQVIIEDYVYRRLWINLNIVFCSLLLIVSIISLGKLVLVGVL